jgi:hypothetical protein
LAESHRQPLPHQARHDVEVAGGSESDNGTPTTAWPDGATLAGVITPVRITYPIKIPRLIVC